jgi:sugar (pentulose or hexulose) kinase
VQDTGSDIGAAMIASAASQGGDLAEGLDKFNSSTIEQIEPQSDQISIYEEKYQDFLELINPLQSQEIR